MSANEMPERIWLSPEGAHLPYQPTMHWKWQEYHRSDLSASEQQVRALDPRIYRLNAEALAEIKATVDGESDQDVGHIIYGLLDEIAALTPAPQPEATENYADPDSSAPQPAGEAVPSCFACEDNPKHPNIPCAVCGAHTPQPSETVAEALSGLMEAYKEIADSGDAGFWKAEETPEYQAAVAALRALKGENNE